MKIAGITRDSITNGEGVRDVIFVQGCPHHCKGCHNPQTWSSDGGTDYTPFDIVNELADSTNDITISGGEPLVQFTELLTLLQLIKTCTTKRVWLYTGYTVDLKDERFNRLVRYVDVVVDGRYIEEQKNDSLVFKGSANQRIIDLKASFRKNKIIEWEGSEYDQT